MKSVYRKSIIIIAIFVIFLAVTQWILWYHASEKYIPPHDYPTYDSLEQYTKENTNSQNLYKIIAKNEDYAVSLVYSNDSSDLQILSKIQNGKWQLLIRDYDYKIKFYAYKNVNRDFHFIDFFTLLNNNTKIVVVEKAVNSTTIGEYVPDEKIEKFKNISDSQNTIFNFAAKPSREIHAIYTYYVGFIDNFDKDTYTLYINDKAYPYKQWKKLLR
ncbi:MAG: hypothetical protein GYA50_02725 [Eubacteriaceae bacterium]|nr:hypothetical protein [Eubacteriaceae bacterium]